MPKTPTSKIPNTVMETSSSVIVNPALSFESIRLRRIVVKTPEAKCWAKPSG